MINKINKLKAVLGIATLLSPSILLSMTSEQKRELITTKKKNKAKLDQLIKQDLTRMTEAEYKTWKFKTDQAIKALQNINPAIAAPYQKTIKNLVAANEIKASLAKINKDIEDEKNKTIANFNKFDRLLRDFDKKTSEIKDPRIQKNITKIATNTIKKLANTTYTYVTTQLDDSIVSLKAEIKKITRLEKREPNKLNQSGYNKTRKRLENILRSIPKIFKNKGLILYKDDYLKVADKTTKEKLSNKITIVFSLLHSLHRTWCSYILAAFLKKPKPGSTEEKNIVTQAIDEIASIITDFANKMIARNASLFKPEQLKQMRDENNRSKQLLETLEKMFKNTYN